MPHAIRIHETGGPEVLRWEEVAAGAPGPGEIRLRQTAIGLNFVDIYYRMGLYRTALPFIPGMEGAGVVEAVGPGVSEFREGDRVAYAGVLGGYAETRLLPADRAVRLPDGIDDRTAAAMMLRGMTVRYLIRHTYRVEPGDAILIHAAAGGIGLILCQWAAALGATVIGTVSTEAKAALARAHGCHHAIVTRQEDSQARVMTITAGRGLPVVYDSIGRDSFMASLDCLRPRGLLVLFGQASGPVPPFDLGILAAKGSLFVTRPTLQSYIAGRGELVDSATELFQAVLSGKLRITVDQSFPLRDAAAAQRALEARQTTGSTILIV